MTVSLSLIGLPLILGSVFQWHVLTIFANIVVVPIFGLIIFPATIVGGLIPWLVGPMNEVLQIFQQLLDIMSQLPGQITYGKSATWFVLLLIGLTIWVVKAEKRHRRLLVLLSVYLLGFGGIHLPLAGEVTFFDIGQGDSFLIREPFNKSVVMIDTGGKVHFGLPSWTKAASGQATASRVSVNYLHSLGIHHLDALLLSHQDADHVGDVPVILKSLQVDRLYVPMGMEQNQSFLKRIHGLMAHTVLVPVKAGMSIPHTHLQAVHPFTPGMGENKDSMVLTGRYGRKQFLFTGDLDQAGEKEIMAAYPMLKIDVLKLGHHGSKTASAPDVLRHWQPAIGIISAGRDNRYGHPNQETLATLADQHIQVFSTQQHGMIKYQYVGDQLGRWHTTIERSSRP